MRTALCLAHLLGDEAAEKKWREAALEPWSTNPQVDHLIGQKLSQKYRFAEGVEHQRQSLAFDPNYLPAKFQLSQDLLRLGDEAEGWRLANEVYEGDGYNVAAHNLVVLQESVEKFATLEADGFVLRMDSREAEIYGRRALALLGRARGSLCDKYEVQFDGPIVVEIFPEKQDFAVRTFGIYRLWKASWVCVSAASSRRTVPHPGASIRRTGRPSYGTSSATP